MFIALIDFHVSASDRPRALAALRAEAAEARAMPGNLGYRFFVDPDSATHVGIHHEWARAEDFAAYAASALFARVGLELRPLMTAPPMSRRLSAEVYNTVRG